MSGSAVATPVRRFTPLGDRVAVKVVNEPEVMQNGIHIPQSAVEKPQEGVVVAIGTGRVVNGVLIPLDVKVGDTVVFGKYSGNEIKSEGEVLLLLNHDEIQGRFIYES